MLKSTSVFIGLVIAAVLLPNSCSKAKVPSASCDELPLHLTNVSGEERSVWSGSIGENVAGPLIQDNLEELQCQIGQNRINVVGQCSLWSGDDPVTGSSRMRCTVYCTNLLYTPEESEHESSYECAVQVFDDEGRRLGKSYMFDRVQHMFNWRLDGSGDGELLRVQEFLWGSYYFGLSPQGELIPLLHLVRSDTNGYSPLIFGDPVSAERNTYLAVIPAGKFGAELSTPSGFHWLDDYSTAEGKKASDFSEGYFLIRFSQAGNCTVFWKHDFDLTSMYKDESAE